MTKNDSCRYRDSRVEPSQPTLQDRHDRNKTGARHSRTGGADELEKQTAVKHHHLRWNSAEVGTRAVVPHTHPIRPGSASRAIRRPASSGQPWGDSVWKDPCLIDLPGLYVANSSALAVEITNTSAH